MNRIFILFIVLLLQLNLFAACEREKSLDSINTIKLKDGTELRGEIINSTNTSITVILEKGKRIEVKNSHIIIEEAANFIEGYAPVKIGGKWGYLNKKGAVAILPRFEDAWNFSEGLAVIKIAEKYGCIDLNGNYVIEPQFQYMTRFSEGLSGVIKENHGYYIDRTGKIKFEADYDILGVFQEGMAAVDSGGKWGFIDSTANLRIALLYEEVRDFKEGLAAVRFQGKWGYLNKKGDFFIKSQFEFASSFSEGIAFVTLDTLINRRYNSSIFIDKSGNMVFSKRFCGAGQVKDGWSPIAICFLNDEGEIDYLWSLWNVRREKMIELQFENLGLCNYGLAPAKWNNKWGVIDTLGNIVLEACFDSIGVFFEGLAPVLFDSQWDYINKNANLMFGLD